MLERDDQHPRKTVAEPCLCKIILLLRSIIEPIRRAEREVALDVVHGIAGGLAIVVARQQHRGAEVDRAAPELRQHRALELEALDVGRVGRNLNRWDHLIRHQLDRRGLRGIDVELLRRAVQIAGRAHPLLAFPLIVVHPQDVSVGAAEFAVDVHHRLHVVVAGGNVRERIDRRAEIGGVDDGDLPGLQLLDVAAEERAAGAAGLQARLAIAIARDHDEHSPGDRVGVRGGGE